MSHIGAPKAKDHKPITAAKKPSGPKIPNRNIPKLPKVMAIHIQYAQPVMTKVEIARKPVTPMVVIK